MVGDLTVTYQALTRGRPRPDPVRVRHRTGQPSEAALRLLADWHRPARRPPSGPTPDRRRRPVSRR
ncbi:hypothetical protein NKH77_35795 [Streptomyces sp. M19]